MMAESFFSRWSRRKSGKEQEEMSPEELLQQAPVAPTPETSSIDKASEENQAPPPVTLEDVEKIDRFAPDFSAFMKPGVDPVVQQAALKKMFTDPHFNIMDGLDIYIDDYSKPDPLTPGMLERMAQSDMLNLFNKQPESVAAAEGVDQPVAQSDSTENSTSAAESETALTSSDIEGSQQSKDSGSPSSELEHKKT